METYNQTSFPNIEKTLEEKKLTKIKQGKNNWRGRYIVLYEHPYDPAKVISDGITFDGTMRVISEEDKKDWAREMDQTGDFVTN